METTHVQPLALCSFLTINRRETPRVEWLHIVVATQTFRWKIMIRLTQIARSSPVLLLISSSLTAGLQARKGELWRAQRVDGTCTGIRQLLNDSGPLPQYPHGSSIFFSLALTVFPTPLAHGTRDSESWLARRFSPQTSPCLSSCIQCFSCHKPQWTLEPVPKIMVKVLQHFLSTTFKPKRSKLTMFWRFEEHL